MGWRRHLLDVVSFTGDREAGLGALLSHCEFVTQCHKISDWLSREAFTYNSLLLQYGLAVIIMNLCVSYLPSNQGLHRAQAFHHTPASWPSAG